MTKTAGSYVVAFAATGGAVDAVVVDAVVAAAVVVAAAAV